MEFFPSEYLSPPAPLVALVGLPHLHGRISHYLQSCNPSMASISVQNVRDVRKFCGKEKRPLDAKLPPPVGFFKSEWLTKHRHRSASALVLLLDKKKVYGDSVQWQQVLDEVDEIKDAIHGRNVKLLLLLVQKSVAGEINEERFLALKKRSEVEPRCCITFVESEGPDLQRSLSKTAGLLLDLAYSFYREEGRRVKSRLDKKTFSHWELSVRYCVKLAFYAEFRRDWASALKNYESAYILLLEGFSSLLAITAVDVQPILTLMELKSMAELLFMKISTLLLHGSKEVEAVRFFRTHSSFFASKVGPPEGSFLHWHWMARQHHIFAQLLQKRVAAGPQPLAPPPPLSPSSPSTSPSKAPPPTAGRPIVDAALKPAYYFQLAAQCMVHRRRALEASQATLEAFSGDEVGEDPLQGGPDSVAAPLYIGQVPRLVARGSSVHEQRPSEEEYLRHILLTSSGPSASLDALALFRTARQLYQDSGAVRSTCQVSLHMAREHIHARQYEAARNLLEDSAQVYRTQGWPALLSSALGYLRECARQLANIEDYASYSLQLASLPCPAGSQPVSGPDVGPAGPLSPELQLSVQSELLRLFQGSGSTLPAREGDVGMFLGPDRGVRLQVDAQSPVRSAMAACGAFHESRSKPGLTCAFSLALVSHLPEPLTLSSLQVKFNRPDHDRTLTAGDGNGNGLADLTLLPGRWRRITLEVLPVRSGQLECVEAVAHLSPYVSLHIAMLAPLSSALTPLHLFEPSAQGHPLASPYLSSLGQTSLLVQDPDPLVSLQITCPPLSLLGEAFPVLLQLTSRGHPVLQGSLRVKIRCQLALEGGSGSLDSSAGDSVHVGFLEASSGGELLIDLPPLGESGQWEALFHARWHRPMDSVVEAALEYRIEEEGLGSNPGDLFRVSATKFVRCEHPFSSNFRFVGPYRKDLLLLPAGDTPAPSPSTDTPEKLPSLPLGTPSTLIATLQCSTDVPIFVRGVSAVQSDADSCQIVSVGPQEEPCGSPEVRLGPGESFSDLFSIFPKVDAHSLSPGQLAIAWRRDPASLAPPRLRSPLSAAEVNSLVSFPRVSVVSPPLEVSVKCPDYGVLGRPFTLSISVRNRSARAIWLDFSLMDSSGFLMSGAHSGTHSVLPGSTSPLLYRLVPISSGMLQLPRVKLSSAQFNAKLHPTPYATKMFVYPTEGDGVFGRLVEKVVEAGGR